MRSAVRASILECLISKVQAKMRYRYLSVLKLRDVRIILEHGLNPAVKNICEKRSFGLEECGPPSPQRLE